MNILYKIALSSLALGSLNSCSESNDNFPTTSAELQVQVNDTLLIASRDTAPVEGGREVSVAPKNGEVLVDAFTIKYIPGTNFKGEDYLEITNKGSIGDGNYFTTSVEKYSITVE